MPVRRIVLLIVAATIVAAGCGSAARPTASHAPVSKSPVPSAGPATTAAPAPRMLRAAVSVGADTAWAWTSTAAGLGPERIDRTTDGGRTWHEVTPPALAIATKARLIQGFYALDTRHAWIGYGSLAGEVATTFLVTADGGASWAPLGRSPRYGCQLQFVDPGDGWCIDAGGAAGSMGVNLYRTRDGGHTWHEVSSTSPRDVGPNGAADGKLPFGCDKDIGFSSSSDGWASFYCAGGMPPLYRTTDGGATWVQVPIAQPSGLNLADGSEFANPPVTNGVQAAIAYTVNRPDSRTIIFRSADAGRSWSPVPVPRRAAWWTVDLATPTHWYLMHGDQLLATQDAGSHWQLIAMDHRFRLLPENQSSSPPRPTLAFTSDRDGWVDAGEAGLWHTADGGRHWTRLRPP